MLICLLLLAQQATAQKQPLRVLALYESGGHHVAYSAEGKKWLDKWAGRYDFTIDYIQHTDSITDTYLTKYGLIIQLDYVPYGWKPAAMEAFKKYIMEGRGGWIGFHHATLLGEFDGQAMWPWFSEFMGGIRFKNYIPDFATGTVIVENIQHPVMKGIPGRFTVEMEEWYTYDKSPRPNVQVMARVDESTYQPDSPVKMGDHPVVWSNPVVKARNVYIFMGHSPKLFENDAYRKLFVNAILWASGRSK